MSAGFASVNIRGGSLAGPDVEVVDEDGMPSPGVPFLMREVGLNGDEADYIIALPSPVSLWISLVPDGAPPDLIECETD
ncbi:MAG: hypothetical protein U0168_18610 [Nannocystaceae bacterium]